MQGFHEKHLIHNGTKDTYLEFNFFDGVMVDCSDRDSSWNSSSIFSEDSSMTSAAARQETEDGIGDHNVDRNSRSNASCQIGASEDIAVVDGKQGVRKPCMSSLGIYMCDCEEDSIHCNLVTGTPSPAHEIVRKVRGCSIDKAAAREARLNNTDCGNLRVTSEQKQGNAHFVRMLTWSSSSKGDHYNERTSGVEFANKSAIAAWAAVVSDFPCSSLIPSKGLVETVSLKKGSRSASCKERVPTLASHLELTENAVIQGKLCEEDMGIMLAMPNVPRHVSTFNNHLAGLTLDVGNVSMRDPVPFGTLHGFIHCTFKDGLPNYTFLLDDYEEVLSAKIWLEDVRLGERRETWKYSFYSLREEKKRKGKSGWKNWRRKDQLIATLLGRMKVSSVFSTKETCNICVKSECILFSSRLVDVPATVKCSKGNTQAHAGNSETHYGNDFDCTSSLPGIASASIMSSPVSAFYTSSPASTASEVAPRSRQATQMSCRNSIIHKTACDANAHASPNTAHTSHEHSELAALIIDVPLKLQNVKEKHAEASITVILPSGNHGRPLHDIKGPSPLISRWKEGGKCDCKGWDLGCGLTVLRNSMKRTEICIGRSDGEDCNKSLRLYKQDADEEDASFSLASQANGLIAVDFCAPLSPLQAFAIAVATLHSRDSEAAVRARTSAEKACKKEEDASPLVKKASWHKSPANASVNSTLKKAWQPQIAMDNSFVKVHASELELLFERV